MQNSIEIPASVIRSAQLSADAFGQAFIYKAAESVSNNVSNGEEWFVRIPYGRVNRAVVMAATVDYDGTVNLMWGFTVA